MASICILVASINGLIAVAAGAAASHLFAQDPRALALMNTGSQYQIYHALALLAAATLAGKSGGSERLLAAAAWLFIAGMVLFSGGLYAHALSGMAVFGRVVPFGGTAFMLGWALLGLYAWTTLRRGMA